MDESVRRRLNQRLRLLEVPELSPLRAGGTRRASPDSGGDALPRTSREAAQATVAARRGVLVRPGIGRIVTPASS